MFDAETDLHYNYWRDYDPTLGRYIQSDPIGLAGGLNTYGYVGGNPVNAVDPTGENPMLFAMLGGAAVGAIVDFGFQLYDNGGRLSCLDFGRIGEAAAVGALFGGGGGLARGVIARALGRGGATAVGDAAAGGARSRIAANSSNKAKDLLGNNPKYASSRTNTDLPGGRSTAKSIFRNQAKGQKVKPFKPSSGGEGRVSENGTRIRFNKDGSTRIDLPGRGPRGQETIHFGP